MRSGKLKGVRFHITQEMIKQYRKLPVEARLAWLAEANELSYYGLSPTRRKIWEKFRRGEI